MKHVAACAAIVAATSAVGEEYSLALGAHGQRADVANVETDVVGINATYYFPPIDDARGPFSLAPFLSRSSRVTVEAHREVATTSIASSSPITGPSTTVFDSETEGGSISARYVLRSSGWYAGGGYRAGGGGPGRSTLTRADLDVDGYSLHAGKYISAATSLELGWNSTDSTAEVTYSGCLLYPICLPLGGTRTSKSRAEEASVRVFHVGDIGRLVYSVTGRAASSRTDRSVEIPDAAPSIEFRVPGPAAFRAPNLPSSIIFVESPPPLGVPPGGGYAGGGYVSTIVEPPASRVHAYSAAFEVFPTARLGVGVGYSRWSGDTLEDDAYDVSVDWFFLRNVAVGVRLARTNRRVASDALDHVDDAGLRLTGRF